jgi:phytoene dehydrogenase-like protein
MGIGDLVDTEPSIGVTVAGQGEALSLACDPRQAAERIRRLSPRDADRWPDFVARLRALAGFLEALYQLPPPDLDAGLSLGELGPLLGLGRKFRSLGRGDMTELLRVLPMSVQDLADEWFENEVLKAAIAGGGIRDIRQGPRSGGTSYVLLHYLVGAPTGSVRTRGWWRDGPDAFTVTAEALARKAGVAIRIGAQIAQIIVKDDAVKGVALTTGEEISAPVVISTADPAKTLRGMVDPVWLDPEFLHAVKQIKFRGCTTYVAYALDALPEVTGLADPRGALASVVSLTTDTAHLERSYDAAKYGRISEQPHVEFMIPSLRWPRLAPDGKHVLVARAQYTPYRLSNDATWDDAGSSVVADCVTSALGRVMPRFTQHVVARAVLSPKDLEARFGFTEGAVTHGEITLDQIMFMRPVAGWGRYSTPVDGLFLGGAGSHPGPGILGASGWLAAKRAIAR